MIFLKKCGTILQKIAAAPYLGEYAAREEVLFLDDRKEVLKGLKKECKIAKREHYAGWKFLAILVLLVALLCALVVAAKQLQDCKPILDSVEQIKTAIGRVESDWGLDLSGVRRWWSDGHPTLIAQTAGTISLILFVVFAAQWSRGKKKWKHSQAYLDHRTMKVTLQAEKLAVKGK